MNNLYTTKEAQEIGILHPVACEISNIAVKDSGSELDDDISELLYYLNTNYYELNKTPEVIGFRKLFESIGYKGQFTAGERLVISYMEKGFKKINNIVDAYNIISAKYMCGIGMHDADVALGNNEDILISTSSGNEKITPLFKNKETTIKPGEIIYGRKDSLEDVFAWLGKKDIDSDKFKVTKHTNNLLIMVTGNSLTSQDFNKNICSEIFQKIKKVSPNADMNFYNKPTD